MGSIYIHLSGHILHDEWEEDESIADYVFKSVLMQPRDCIQSLPSGEDCWLSSQAQGLV